MKREGGSLVIKAVARTGQAGLKAAAECAQPDDTVALAYAREIERLVAEKEKR